MSARSGSSCCLGHGLVGSGSDPTGNARARFLLDVFDRSNRSAFTTGCCGLVGVSGSTAFPSGAALTACACCTGCPGPTDSKRFAGELFWVLLVFFLLRARSAHYWFNVTPACLLPNPNTVTQLGTPNCKPESGCRPPVPVVHVLAHSSALREDETLNSCTLSKFF